MTKVIGEFTATVPAPIVVAPSILNEMNQRRVPSVHLSINESDVRVQLGEQTEPILDESGYAEVLPKISGFKVWITRDVQLGSSLGDGAILSMEDEREYEQVLIEALERVVSSIKLRTGQSSIDTRHPVHSYGYKYHRDDEAVGTLFPVQEGFHRLPLYFLDAIAFDAHCLELDTGMWEAVEKEVTSAVEIPLFDQLLHDAATFRTDMNYQMAALSAAISVELQLVEICTTLLIREGNLRDSQARRIIEGRRPMDLVKILKALDPDSPISYKEIQSTFENRNRIAHGKSRHTSRETMANMIATARRIRGVLSSLEGPP